MLSAIISAMTTRNQRALARRNYRFKINSIVKSKEKPSDFDGTSESGSDFDKTLIEDKSELTNSLRLDRHRIVH